MKRSNILYNLADKITNFNKEIGILPINQLKTLVCFTGPYQLYIDIDRFKIDKILLMDHENKTYKEIKKDLNNKNINYIKTLVL